MNPIEGMTRLIRWMKAPPERPNPRWLTILMWTLIIGTCVFVVQADNNADEKARHEAVCVVRFVMSDFINFAEELGGPADVLEQWRMRLDHVIPDENC